MEPYQIIIEISMCIKIIRDVYRYVWDMLGPGLVVLTREM